MFIDWIGIVLICFPLFLPIAKELGFDPVWFVVMIAVNLQASFLTPPFGYALFYIKGVAPKDVTLMDIYRGIVPFVLLMIVGTDPVRCFSGSGSVAALFDCELIFVKQGD